MIDHPRPAPGSVPAPAFDPVPRHYNRHDGWTPERQRGFIEALITTGSVRAAAHAVNMTPEGAYLLRRHARAASFRKAWDAALAHGVQRLEDIAMDRALNGTQEPVYSYGKLVGTRIVHNDRLLMFLLRNRAPARFAASQQRLGPDGTRIVTEAQLRRLKQQMARGMGEGTGHGQPRRGQPVNRGQAAPPARNDRGPHQPTHRAAQRTRCCLSRGGQPQGLSLVGGGGRAV